MHKSPAHIKGPYLSPCPSPQSSGAANLGEKSLSLPSGLVFDTSSSFTAETSSGVFSPPHARARSSSSVASVKGGVPRRRGRKTSDLGVREQETQWALPGVLCSTQCHMTLVEGQGESSSTEENFACAHFGFAFPFLSLPSPPSPPLPPSLQTGYPFGRLDTYEKLEELGEGSYATVYKGFSQ